MKSTLLALLVAGISVNTHAVHVDMKPGLWEHNFKMGQSSLDTVAGSQQEHLSNAMEEMKNLMATMPPDQRKMMEETMAQQGIKISEKGIDVAGQGVQITKDGTLVKSCITQADIDGGYVPQVDKNCDQTITQVSPNVIRANYSCEGENPSRGEGQIVFQNNKSYTGTVKFTTEVNKKMETIEGTQSGKWLSTDCGDIKPMTSQAK